MFLYIQFLTLYFEQRIEIILRHGSGSSRMFANAFKRKSWTNIAHNTVAHFENKKMAAIQIAYDTAYERRRPGKTNGIL